MTNTHITPEMRGVIGREYARSVSFPISASDVRRWAIAVYYPAAPPEQFWNDSHGDNLCVPNDFNPFAWMSSEGPPPASSEVAYDPDKQFTTLGVAGPGLTKQVNGGLEVTYGEDMQVGDVITSSACISDLSEREGRLGLMLFTSFETRWTNQTGAEVKRQRMTLIRY